MTVYGTAPARHTQAQLANDDAGVAEDMAALDDGRVMRLTEEEVHQVMIGDEGSGISDRDGR